VFLLQSLLSPFAVVDIGTRDIPTSDVSFGVDNGVVPSQKPTITAIALAQAQFILVGRPGRASTIKIIALPRAVIGMNERKALKSLLPLFTSKAEVIECSAVDIETFAIRSEYRNNVWRRVEYLSELHFLLSNLLFDRLALGDVGHRPDQLNIAGRILKSPGSNVDVSDCPARHQQPTLVFVVGAARGCAFEDLFRKRPVLRMNALEHHVEVWFLGVVVFENAIGLVRPHDLAGIRFPPEAARVT